MLVFCFSLVETVYEKTSFTSLLTMKKNLSKEPFWVYGEKRGESKRGGMTLRLGILLWYRYIPTGPKTPIRSLTLPRSISR